MAGKAGSNTARSGRGKRKPYAIYRKDNTYLIHDLTKRDYEVLVEAFKKGEIAVISIGAIATDDIRSIIEQKPEPVTENRSADPPMPPSYYGYIYGNREEVEGDGI